MSPSAKTMGFRSLFRRKKKGISAPDSQIQSPRLSVSSEIDNGVNHQIEELRQVFEKFDVNHDGKISSSELGSIMASLGQPATEEDLKKMLVEVDSDGDGFLDFDEFVELNTKGVDTDKILEDLKDAFKVFDLDGNGSITAEELQKVMKNLGDECSIAECRKMICGVDSDGDGTISFEEFKVMMMMGSRLVT